METFLGIQSLHYLSYDSTRLCLRKIKSVLLPNMTSSRYRLFLASVSLADAFPSFRAASHHFAQHSPLS